MRKIVLLFFVVLFMAAPVMAVSNVTITCTPSKVGDMNWVTISYASDHNLIRAFGLDINVAPFEGGEPNIIDVCSLNLNYRIYPGQISIVEGDVNDYMKPYDPCDLGDANVAVEMGSLYTTDAYYATDVNAGYNKIPGTSGDLLKFSFKKGCKYMVDVNERRGGIVMEDPYETPSFSRPLCDGNVCGGIEYKDFGDAPQTYSTKLADNPIGPSHLMATATTGIGPRLGSNIDAEADGQPSADCMLDDTTIPTVYPPGDEDGITGFVAVKGSPGSVTVTVSQAGGYLNAWIDWAKDGSFVQAGDQVFTNTPVVVGPQVLPFAIPAGALLNTDLVSRWRVTSYTLPVGKYYGAENDGEVEDYNKPKVVCPPPPNPPGNPNPAASAKCVDQTAILSWTPGTGTVTQDVYFGITNPPPLVASNVPVGTTTYDPVPDMNVYTLYYWQIVEKNICGQTTPGTIWCFATGAQVVAGVQKPCCNNETSNCLGNINTDTRVNTTDYGLLVSFVAGLTNNRCTTAVGSTTCPPCYDLNGSGRVDTTDLGVLASKLGGWVNNRHNCPYPSCSVPP